MRVGRVVFALVLFLIAMLGLNGCGVGTAAPVNPEPTVQFKANPTVVPPTNGSATLTWTSTNATGATIDHGVGTLAASGSVVVKPTATTTYTITVTGPGGTIQAQVTVTVSASAPTVAITADPTTVQQGSPSTLTVTATNATSVVVTNGVDATSITLQPTGGTAQVTPQVTTTYTATATGAGGTVTASATVTVIVPPPTVTITANPTAVQAGGQTTLTVMATNAQAVAITDNVDTTTYPLAATGGTQVVTVNKITTFTASATGTGGTTTASVTVHVIGSVLAVNHVLFMLQENRTFDHYFGMLNPYRHNNGMATGDDGKVYDIDGIEDKLSTISNTNDLGVTFKLFKTTSTCLDDMTSAWLESYGEVNRYDFSTTRKILMDGFVHVAENYAASGAGSGTFTDLAGKRAMAYYDEHFLNYYYYMASQFALSDRWFSPVSSKSTPNRIATMTGGTTQGLVRDPFVDDKFTGLTIKTIFEQLDTATPPVSWKIYYSLIEPNGVPDTTFTGFTYSGKYIYSNPTHAACTPPLTPGNAANDFCIDTSHIAPLTQLYTDMANGTLPSFSYIEAGYGANDEHPGSGQSILQGQSQAANIINKLMASPSWVDSVFFLSYDEGGGPYDHVPPVPGHTNDFTDASLGVTTDIGSIAVNPDAFNPCLPAGGTPTVNCDLKPNEPGTSPADTATVNGFKAQLGFRLPNVIVSPFTRKHYVSHTPMDHTAVIKFVENRFIGPSASLTARDAAQPDLLEFFDFTAVPWATPPTPPAPVTDASLGANTCTPDSMGP